MKCSRKFYGMQVNMNKLSGDFWKLVFTTIETFRSENQNQDTKWTQKRTICNFAISFISLSFNCFPQWP